MEKNIIIQEILQHSKRAGYMTKPFTWKEIREILEKENVVLQDDDIVEIGYTEGWQEGDTARDSYYDFTVKRPRLETDTEFDKRKERAELNKKFLKNQRRETYLKLKEEFENE